MIHIAGHPADVADRSVPDHWEGGVILEKWHTSARGTIVERKTRSLILVPPEGRDAATDRKAFERKMKTLPEKMKLCLTYDKGKEVAEHKLFTKNTKIKVYISHPRSPRERGTDETTNGPLRQFFPKGTDCTKVSRKEISKVQHFINTSPRKIPG